MLEHAFVTSLGACAPFLGHSETTLPFFQQQGQLFFFFFSPPAPTMDEKQHLRSTTDDNQYQQVHPDVVVAQPVSDSSTRPGSIPSAGGAGEGGVRPVFATVVGTQQSYSQQGTPMVVSTFTSNASGGVSQVYYPATTVNSSGTTSNATFLVPVVETELIPYGADGNYYSNPRRVMCQFCNHEVITEVDKRIGFKSHFWAAVLCLMGCWPCAPCAYVVEELRDDVHICPNCGSMVGRRVL